MGALVLFSVQLAQDLVLFSGNHHELGRERFGPEAAILLVFSLGVLAGLWLRIPAARWLGVLVLGGFGALYLVDSWPEVRWAIPGLEGPVSRDGVSAIDGAFEPRSMRLFRAFWLMSKILLLLAVPAALLTARLREHLRR